MALRASTRKELICLQKSELCIYVVSNPGLAHALNRSVTITERHAGRVFTGKDMAGVRPIRAESSPPVPVQCVTSKLSRGQAA